MKTLTMIFATLLLTSPVLANDFGVDSPFTMTCTRENGLIYDLTQAYDNRAFLTTSASDIQILIDFVIDKDESGLDVYRFRFGSTATLFVTFKSGLLNGTGTFKFSPVVAETGIPCKRNQPTQ